MNRLQKKCLLGSTLTHGLLLLVIVVCMAFTGSETPQVQTLTFLPPPDADLTDGQSRGGNRDAVPPPAPQPQQPEPPQVQPEPPAPQPEPPKKVVEPEPEPPKPEPVKPTKNEVALPKDPPTKKLDLKPVGKVTSSSEKPERKLELKATVRKSTQTSDKSKAAAAQTKAWQQQLVKNFGSAADNLRDRATSSSTTVEMPGVGDGGKATINYAQYIKTVYDLAWHDPSDVADESAAVKTEVIITRDGTVVSTKILSRSGIPALDKSVQSALERVRVVRPFPSESRDQQRRFLITFSLKAKRSIG